MKNDFCESEKNFWGSFLWVSQKWKIKLTEKYTKMRLKKIYKNETHINDPQKRDSHKWSTKWDSQEIHKDETHKKSIKMGLTKNPQK